MKTCDVGKMVLTLDKKTMRVEVKLVDHVCEHTLIHYVDYDDWKKMAVDLE